MKYRIYRLRRRISDTILKLRLLRGYCYSPYAWLVEVWRRDADDYHCCSAIGYDGSPTCGCEGASNREYWQWLVK